MLARDIADLFASRQGRTSSGNVDFGVIARDFGPKFWRPRKFFEIFGPNRAEIRPQSHTPRHADGRHTHCGPLCIAARPGVVRRCGFRRDRTRFRTEILAAGGPLSQPLQSAANNSRAKQLLQIHIFHAFLRVLCIFYHSESDHFSPKFRKNPHNAHEGSHARGTLYLLHVG